MWYVILDVSENRVPLLFIFINNENFNCILSFSSMYKIILYFVFLFTTETMTLLLIVFGNQLDTDTLDNR